MTCVAELTDHHSYFQPMHVGTDFLNFFPGTNLIANMMYTAVTGFHRLDYFCTSSKTRIFKIFKYIIRIFIELKNIQRVHVHHVSPSRTLSDRLDNPGQY